MQRFTFRTWLAVGILASTMVMGCNSSRRCCCCQAVSYQPISPVASLPQTDSSATGAVDQASTQVVATVHRPVEGKVAMTAVVPGASYGSGVSGTVIMSAADAETIGVRPGHTPDALYVPNSSRLVPLPVVVEPEQKIMPVQHSEQQ